MSNNHDKNKIPGLQISRDAHGNTIIRDEAYQKYLDSTAPNPSQILLDTELARVTKVRIIKGSVIDGKTLGTEVLYETNDTASIAAFKDCLRIIEDPQSFGHCMCHGDHAIELFDEDNPLMVLGLHHGYSIRWDRWKHDGVLQDGTKLLNWLDERGVSGPKLQAEEDQKRELAAQRAEEIWISAMPKSIAAMWKQLDANQMQDMVAGVPRSQQTTQKLYQCATALQKDFPDKHERILALLRWFGSGAWITGEIPVYELVPAALLYMVQPKEILAAAESRQLTETETKGLLRILGDRGFRTEHPCAHMRASESLKTDILSRTDLDAEVSDFAKHLFAGDYDFFFSVPNMKVIAQHYLKGCSTPEEQLKANVTASIVHNGICGRDWQMIRNEFRSDIDLDYLAKEIETWKIDLKEVVKRNRENAT